MGHDERRPTVYSAVPKNLTAPYVIPPLEHDGHGRPKPMGAPMEPGPPRRRSWIPFLVVVIATFVVIPVVVALLAGIGGFRESAPEPPPPVVTAPETAAPASPVPVAPDDPAYPGLDPARLAALLQDPGAHVGEQYTAYVEIQIGTESIPQSLRDKAGLIGFAGAEPPSHTMQDAANPVALMADPGILDAAVRGAVLRVRFQVSSTTDRTSVYNGSGIAELRVVAAETVASFS